jgi:uncharacterized protein YggE
MKSWISYALSMALMASGSSAAYAATAESEISPTPDAVPAIQGDLDGELLAQFFPMVSANQRNITVIGTGRASAPADVAVMQMLISIRDSLLYPDYSVDPPVFPTPPIIRRSDLQPIVDAIVATGIPASDIDVYVGSTPPVGYVDYYASPRIQVRINQPTHSRIQSVISAANGVAEDSPLFYIGQTGVSYGVSNCQVLEARAHQNALQVTQEKAASLASAAGLRLGEILGITGGDAYPANYGFYSCPMDMVSMDPYASPPPYNPFAPLDVLINTSVTVVYEIDD